MLELVERIAARVHSPRGPQADRERLYAELQERLVVDERHPRIRPARGGRTHRVGRWGIAASLLLVVSLGVAGVCVYQWGGSEPSATTTVESPSPEQPAVPLLFRQVPLADIAQQLSRFYGVRIRVASPELAQYRVTATFSADESVTDVLSALCTVARCQWRKTDNGYELFQ